MRGWRLVVFVILTAAIVWLMRTSNPPQPLHPIRPASPVVSDLGSAFDPARCGSLSGRVYWVGPRPTAAPIRLTQVPKPPDGKVEIENPNIPRISEVDGVADAVVFLTGVETTRSKSWPYPPVTVEVQRRGLTVSQGSSRGRYGIVRRGAEVEFISREAEMLSVRARDACFFTQMLPTPDQPVPRVMQGSGIAELSSGSGYFWHRGYLAISDHPYVSVTGADGSFRFDQVPEGRYAVVCWKANWQIDRLERDPELLAPARLHFRPPVNRRVWLTVSPGGTHVVDCPLSVADFDSVAP